MGLRQETASSTKQLLLTPFGEACLRLDLTAIHEILEKTGYKDDEGIANEVFYKFKLLQRGFHLTWIEFTREALFTDFFFPLYLLLLWLQCWFILMLKLQLSFQLWTSQMQETLNLKKHGDTAFRAKDFVTAIDCYTQVRGFLLNHYCLNCKLCLM